MDRDTTFEDAKRLYLESYGDPMVTNTYLKIALVLVSLVALALGLVDLRGNVGAEIVVGRRDGEGRVPEIATP